MSNFTPEQQLAIDKRNSNIIVSAGAGSGKTTVLTERVISELKEGLNINNLVILTFTNNAASEMKERIRKSIEECQEVKDQLDYLDSAYITTFDSFAGSLVKKYNYLLNIDKNFAIIDASIVDTEIKQIIDEIFEELYRIENPDFIDLIKDFCIKDDNDLRESIIDTYHKLVNVINREDYLKSYLDKYYNNNYIEELFNKYENLVFKKQEELANLYEELSNETLNLDKLEQNNQEIANFLNATTYDELRDSFDFKLASATKNVYTDEGKNLKEAISSIKKSIKDNGLLEESKDMLINHYLSTKKYAKIIIEILAELDRKLTLFKNNHNSYEFFDIAYKAIDLVKNYPEVREEIKNSTYEIMIDEYQDTNDIQDTFISYIENNNVYMVGDIKQSIYRFRNANPYLFKQKYDSYKENINGFKIDLNKNFRSREEVVNNINLIFANIMNNHVGGADYKKEHMMIFGNTNYSDIKPNDSYDMTILSYEFDKKDKKYSQEEIEAFMIADDIQRRIKNKEQVVYFENKKLKNRDIEFRDFVILVDKGKQFELIKKILEYKGIPTSIKKDISIKEEDEIYIIKSIINLLIHIHDNNYNQDFKHAYLSVARSYIGKMDDNEIFTVFKNNSFKDTSLFKKCLELANKIDFLSNNELLISIIKEFDFINQIITVGDMEQRTAKLEYFVNNAISLNDFGYDIRKLNDFFDEVLTSENDIKMSINADNSNSVTIMTIHASKGLEYNYVYLPFLSSDWTKNISKNKFDFNTNYGMTLPFYQNGYGHTFTHTLLRNDELLETISEKIRLLYVAVTRAKEKLIMIVNFNEDISSTKNEPDVAILNTVSLRDILSIIKPQLEKYIIKVPLESLNISNDYNLVKDYNYKNYIESCQDKITTSSLKIENNTLDNKHFSSSLTKVVDKDLKEKLDFGTTMHYIFEVYDFKNGNLDELKISSLAKEKIKNFLNHDEVKDIKMANIYKEHEIMFTRDGSLFHGFIDLLLEYDDHFDIIDYKLSNIDKEEYKIQLSGYKDYIENKYQKKANIYLYSINKDKFKKLN